MNDYNKLTIMLKELEGTAKMALAFGLPLDWIMENITLK